MRKWKFTASDNDVVTFENILEQLSELLSIKDANTESLTDEEI